MAICAIVCLTALEMWALYLGFDGTIFSTVVGAIGAVFLAAIGEKVKEPLKKVLQRITA